MIFRVCIEDYLSPDIVWQGKKDIENLEMPSEYI